MTPPDLPSSESSTAHPPALAAKPFAPMAVWNAGVLGWSAWQRLLAVAPLLVLLWLAVFWALPEAAASP